MPAYNQPARAQHQPAFLSTPLYLLPCPDLTKQPSVSAPLITATPCSYGQPMPSAEDYAKEPPNMPPHLQLTLLNVPPAMDATASLPRPQHVILNHLYIQRSSQNANALVVGTTHRYEAAQGLVWC